MENGLREAAASAGVPVQVNRVGSMVGLFFAGAPVNSVADARAMDTSAYGRFFWALLKRGVYLPPAPFETLFLSAAHIRPDLDRTLIAIADAFKEVARR